MGCEAPITFAFHLHSAVLMMAVSYMNALSFLCSSLGRRQASLCRSLWC